MSSTCILLAELHQVYESRAIDVSDKVPISPTLASVRHTSVVLLQSTFTWTVNEMEELFLCPARDARWNG